MAEGKCSACHRIHDTDNRYYLLKKGVELYISICYKNIDFYLKDKFVHEPIRQGNCIACHNPHGSKFSRILMKDFTYQYYYTPFDLNKFIEEIKQKNNKINSLYFIVEQLSKTMNIYVCSSLYRK